MSQVFNEFHIEQVSREHNVVANLLANLAIHHGIVEWKTINLEYQDQPHICGTQAEVNYNTIKNDDWRCSFLEFLMHKTQHEDG